jgi:hypothetical protein
MYLISAARLRVITFASAPALLDSEKPDCPGCRVLDLNLLVISRLDLQAQLADEAYRIAFITGHGDIPCFGACDEGWGCLHGQFCYRQRERAQYRHNKIASMRPVGGACWG